MCAMRSETTLRPPHPFNAGVKSTSPGVGRRTLVGVPRDKAVRAAVLPAAEVLGGM
eukprot:SAG31_NODE_595_length_13695_cov_11.446896_4_plen_56_part_00